jgi:hypothetical protein
LVRERIDAAAKRSGRAPESVRLVAVSKTMTAEAVAQAARAGLALFGENRVQEAAEKAARVAALVPGSTLSWHLVGHLQSNKAKAAVGLFDLVHSVDDAELARRLDRAAQATGKRQRVLLQVNVAGEATKSGVALDDLRALADVVSGLTHLDLQGLMTIPPHDPDPEVSRRHFAALRELGGRLAAWTGAPGSAAELSMGMTEDFEVAIEEGATFVRVGRAIFGERG